MFLSKSWDVMEKVEGFLKRNEMRQKIDFYFFGVTILIFTLWRENLVSFSRSHLKNRKFVFKHRKPGPLRVPVRGSSSVGSLWKQRHRRWEQPNWSSKREQGLRHWLNLEEECVWKYHSDAIIQTNERQRGGNTINRL